MLVLLVLVSCGSVGLSPDSVDPTCVPVASSTMVQECVSPVAVAVTLAMEGVKGLHPAVAFSVQEGSGSS